MNGPAKNFAQAAFRVGVFVLALGMIAVAGILMLVAKMQPAEPPDTSKPEEIGDDGVFD